jgi:hypothetical protein
MQCPKCQSQRISKKGFSVSGKQRYRCKDCNHHFTGNPAGKPPHPDSMTNAERCRRYRLKKKQKNTKGVHDDRKPTQSSRIRNGELTSK